MDSDLVEVNEHMPGSAEHLTNSVGRRILHEPWVFHPVKECLERGVDFQAGKRTTEA